MPEKVGTNPQLEGKLKTYTKNKLGIYVGDKTADIKPGQVVIFARGFEPLHTDLNGMPSMVREFKEMGALQSWAYFSRENQGIFLSPAKGKSFTIMLDPSYPLQSNYVENLSNAGLHSILLGFISTDKKLIEEQVKSWQERLPKNPSTGYRIS